MTFSKGDTVQIKSEYALPLDGKGYHERLFFAPVMSRYCGQVVKIKGRADTRDTSSDKVWSSNDKVWEVTGNTWLWHEDWLISTEPFIKDEDFEI